MKIKKKNIKKYTDSRGCFYEYFNFKKDKFSIKQVNISISKKNVLRGMHYQKKNPQAKLIRVLEGKIFDVILDLRRSSATFGKFFTFILSANDKNKLYIPRGFAHGFLTLSKKNIILYSVDNYYDPLNEKTILWNDKKLKIPWPRKKDLKLSKKDKFGEAFNTNQLYFN